MQIRNSITILDKISESFPMVTEYGCKIQRFIIGIEKHERRGDLKLMIRAYKAILAQRKPNWVEETSFRTLMVATPDEMLNEILGIGLASSPSSVVLDTEMADKSNDDAISEGGSRTEMMEVDNPETESAQPTSIDIVEVSAKSAEDLEVGEVLSEVSKTSGDKPAKTRNTKKTKQESKVSAKDRMPSKERQPKNDEDLPFPEEKKQRRFADASKEERSRSPTKGSKPSIVREHRSNTPTDVVDSESPNTTANYLNDVSTKEFVEDRKPMMSSAKDDKAVISKGTPETREEFTRVKFEASSKDSYKAQDAAKPKAVVKGGKEEAQDIGHDRKKKQRETKSEKTYLASSNDANESPSSNTVSAKMSPKREDEIIETKSEDQTNLAIIEAAKSSLKDFTLDKYKADLSKEKGKSVNASPKDSANVPQNEQRSMQKVREKWQGSNQSNEFSGRQTRANYEDNRSAPNRTRYESSRGGGDRNYSSKDEQSAPSRNEHDNSGSRDYRSTRNDRSYDRPNRSDDRDLKRPYENRGSAGGDVKSDTSAKRFKINVNTSPHSSKR